jgi:hypothetical protein
MTTSAPANAPATSAVVFIEASRAVVGRARGGDRVVIAIARRQEVETAFLGRVAHEIETADRIVVMGPSDERLALEREYVLLTHRPDRLVHDEAAVEMTRPEVLARLAELAA